MAKFFDSIGVLFAKVYNPLHPKLKIALMVTTSFIVSGVINLLIRDMTNFNEAVTNEYLQIIIAGLIPLLTAVVNVVQEIYVKAGTKVLAAQGDPDTIQKLTESIATKRVLIKSSK